MARDELQERLGGGLPRGALVVLEGAHGAGKSVLSQRLAFGALSAGHRVAYVSTELTSPQFFRQMASLGYPVVRHALEERLWYVPAVMMEPGGASSSLLERLLSAVDVFERDIVFIDTFSSFLRQAREEGCSEAGLRRLVQESIRLIKAVNGRGTTVVLTLDPREAEEDLTRPLASVSEVLASARTEVVGLTTARTLLFHRFSRAGSSVGDVVGFRVEPGAGLIIEIRSVS